MVAKALAVLAALSLVVHFGARRIQRDLMYFPDAARVQPQSLGLAGVEEIVIEAPDGARVISWYGKAAPGMPVILYYHGNAGSPATRSERIRKYMLRGYGVFMMTYRSFGGSTGTPSEAANVADARRAYDRLRSLGVSAGDIVLYGESLGSGIAVQIAAEKPVAGIILDAPYTSMLDLARLHYPRLPAGLFLTDIYNSAALISGIRVPLLIVHGEEDDVVPVSMGRKLFELANEPKKIVTFPAAGHSDHHLHGSYETIYEWLERLEAAGSASELAPARRA